MGCFLLTLDHVMTFPTFVIMFCFIFLSYYFVLFIYLFIFFGGGVSYVSVLMYVSSYVILYGVF